MEARGGMAEAAPAFSADAHHHESEARAVFLLALRSQGVRHTGILRAMERVPRASFAPRRFADLARADLSVPLPCGQTMTAPSIVAQMLLALDPQPGQSVLEVGTGSGYVAALLADMGLKVTTLERYRGLALAAHERFAALGITGIEVVHGDGHAPPRLSHERMDRILVNGVVDAVPDALLARLAPGGRMVAAIIIDGMSRLVTMTRSADAGGAVDHRLGAALRLPPLGQGIARTL
jgi:protein-L-isoaspartate(D-aspartate) O-methyltransferase